MTKALLLGLLLLGGCQTTPPPSTGPGRAELNAQAAKLLWTKPNAARTLLERASTLPADNADDWARTKVAMGHAFMAKKRPENALDAWLPVLERRKEVHPSILSSTCQAVGQIYRQAGDKENAKRYFRLAVEYGKKVKYPYDFKASAKALEELERKDAK